MLVNPVIVRDPVWNASLWTFHGSLELMRALRLVDDDGRTSSRSQASGGGTYGFDAVEEPGDVTPAPATRPLLEEREREGEPAAPPAAPPESERPLPERGLRRVG